MDANLGSQMGPARRENLVERLGQLVESGRVTEAEATRLRAAAGPAEFDVVVRDISMRHVGAELSAAVEAGQLTQPEAGAYLERIKAGQHPRSLRAHLRRLRSQSPGDGGALAGSRAVVGAGGGVGGGHQHDSGP